MLLRELEPRCRRLLQVLFVAILAMLTASPAVSQGLTGQISGIVLDPSGAQVPDGTKEFHDAAALF